MYIKVPIHTVHLHCMHTVQVHSHAHVLVQSTGVHVCFQCSALTFAVDTSGL